MRVDSLVENVNYPCKVSLVACMVEIGRRNRISIGKAMHATLSRLAEFRTYVRTPGGSHPWDGKPAS